MSEKTLKVGLYWDFENLHASALDVKYGEKSYFNSRFKSQEPIVNINAVIQFANSIGDISINRAYANWSKLDRYRIALLENSMELIQMFHPGANAKNGADIRLAIDVIEDIQNHADLTHIIVVGGDSDYISVAQRCKKSGLIVIGIAVENSANQFWIKACSEFKFYRTLLGKTGASKILDEIKKETNVEDARELIVRAVQKLASFSEDNKANKAAIKPAMKKLDPTFDEGNYGFLTFTSFFEACEDLLETEKSQFDHMVTLNEKGLATIDRIQDGKVENENVASGFNEDEDSSAGRELPLKDAITEYYSILLPFKYTPMQYSKRCTILREMYLLNQKQVNDKFKSFEDLRDQVFDAINSEEQIASEDEIGKVTSMLFGMRMFNLYRLEDKDDGISIRSFNSASKLIESINSGVIQLLVKNADPPLNAEAMFQILFYESEGLEKDGHRFIDEIINKWAG